MASGSNLFRQIFAQTGGKRTTLSSQLGALQAKTTPTQMTMHRGASRSQAMTLVPMYSLPSSAKRSEKDAWMSFLLFCATAVSMSLLEVKCWLYSLTDVLYSDLISAAEGREFRRIVVTQSNMDTLLRKVLAAMQITGNSATDLSNRAIELVMDTSFPYLPIGDNAHSALLDMSDKWISVSAFYGIICFSLGKDITGSGGAALTVARPAAVLDKYRYDPDNFPHIGGAMAPSDALFTHAYQAWRELPFLRRAIFAYMATMERIETSVEDEAVYTTVRLMAWCENAHIAIIMRYLSENPAAVYMPDLASHWARFVRGFQGLIDMCDPVRDGNGQVVTGSDGKPISDLHQLPYVKVIYLDIIRAGGRDENAALLDVAYRQLVRTDARLAQYIPPGIHLTLAAKAGEFLTNYAEFEAAELNRMANPEDSD